MIKRLFLMLLSLSITLYLSEIILERQQAATDRQYGRNDETTTWGHPVKNNHLGFRERELTQKKGYRIMVLGDSFTWGVGLSEDERYSNVLQRLLAAKGVKAEVFNFGLHGAPTSVEAQVLKRFVSICNPDLVVVGFCYNDPWTDDTSWRRYLLQKEWHSWFDGLQGLSSIGFPAFSSTAKEATLATAQVTGKIPNWVDSVNEAYRVGSPEWQTFVSSLKEIKSTSDKNGLKPPVFIVLNSGQDQSLYLRWWHQAERAAKRTGFVTVNCEREVADLAKMRSTVVNKYDQHPNAAVNRIYAGKLLSLF